MTALRARTWYDATAITPPTTQPITSINGGVYDVAIIGAGLAGLVSALTLAHGGARVIVLETDHIGSGASGRNGGFCSAGWAADHAQITKQVGALLSQLRDHQLLLRSECLALKHTFLPKHDYQMLNVLQ